jgi:hypothetical protein
MEIRQIRDADFSESNFKYAQLELTLERLIDLDVLNNKLTIEMGFRAKLSFHDIRAINNQYKYIMDIVPDSYVPRNSWQEATDYLIAHLRDVL